MFVKPKSGRCCFFSLFTKIIFKILHKIFQNALTPWLSWHVFKKLCIVPVGCPCNNDEFGEEIALVTVYQYIRHVNKRNHTRGRFHIRFYLFNRPCLAAFSFFICILVTDKNQREKCWFFSKYVHHSLFNIFIVSLMFTVFIVSYLFITCIVSYLFP